MTTNTAEHLELKRLIRAPIEAVFAAWTEPDRLRHWSAPEGMNVPAAEVDLTVGGRFHIPMRSADGTEHNARGVYREVVRPSRLVYTWSWDEHPEAGESLITVEFRQVEGGTELRMVHAGLPSEDQVEKHATGWTSCFDRLEKLLA